MPRTLIAEQSRVIKPYYYGFHYNFLFDMSEMLALFSDAIAL